jgi:chlorobactene glucosyltransferase
MIMNSDLAWLMLSTIFFFAGFAITYWVHNQQYIRIIIPRADPPPQSNAPLISIIVPARNEERNIIACLEGLVGQDYPDLEWIVVDDRSSDSTLAILQNFVSRTNPGDSSKVQIISGGDLPQGWAGKPHALHQGVAHARGEWLCFVDADTFATPLLISSTYQAAKNSSADMLTILTDQQLGSFWEKVIMPLVFTALSVGFPADRVNDPSKPDAIANGQFILIRRGVYEAVGGHKAVRSEIAEDKALAVLVKGQGHRLVLADGRQFARTRMYTSLPEIWEGWTKNIYLGLQDRLWLLGVGALTGLVGALFLPLWTALCFLWALSSGSWMAYLALSQSLLLWSYLVFQRVKACRALQINSWYALTLPLGALVFTSMMFSSAFKVISGQGVTWRGRSYP